MKNHFIRHAIFKMSNRILPKHTGREAYLVMQERINCGEPLMVARFGAVEIKAVLYAVLPPPD